ncbi:MAG: hypothetical protein A2751_03900 [Candidatus Doudnabacteria bacterium RIFCSPHIGHO2_01_FULL_46_14]|uniref:Uncharacterized protein n=1 Tax=Candidatus Doudnabacteria bacterium RIFCSPHIGHO2_01_FULL_46_14 TaxID=1817824 RepID=A0A1F5NKX2_9BACT|nr:MAG: hypothetical protein A2751_03900 [Candidatus Doudnabacteria bacterium RIFCSPHIGHO2_01_FULL_46_14]
MADWDFWAQSIILLLFGGIVNTRVAAFGLDKRKGNFILARVSQKMPGFRIKSGMTGIRGRK